MLTIHPVETIVSDPTIRNGKLIIAGTTIALVDVIASYNSGRSTSPEELAVNYNLALGQVFAALAFYYDHREEVEAERAREEARADELIEALRARGKLIDRE
jgi:uncharacterized protein (DUF433 family)